LRSERRVVTRELTLGRSPKYRCDLAAFADCADMGQEPLPGVFGKTG